MAKVRVYVDGFNLYYGALKDGPHKWLDLESLFRRLLPNDAVVAIRYFTARVKSRPGDQQAPVRQNAYLRALATSPRVSIHYGNFLTTKKRMALVDPPAGCPKTAEVFRTEEKGSDVNLATHLLIDGFLADYETAVVVSNDSDLIEPVSVVRERLAKPVGVVLPDQQTVRGAIPADFYRRPKVSDLAASQFPPTLTDASGKTIRKPSVW